MRGNRAIHDHLKNGKQLHLFEYSGPGEYRYLGQFEYSSHDVARGRDALGAARQIIRFHLRRSQQ